MYTVPEAAPEQSGPYIHATICHKWGLALSAHAKANDEHIKVLGKQNSNIERY